jgi:hypothetical protein
MLPPEPVPAPAGGHSLDYPFGTSESSTLEIPSPGFRSLARAAEID